MLQDVYLPGRELAQRQAADECQRGAMSFEGQPLSSRSQELTEAERTGSGPGVFGLA